MANGLFALASQLYLDHINSTEVGEQGRRILASLGEHGQNIIFVWPDGCLTSEWQMNILHSRFIHP